MTLLKTVKARLEEPQSQAAPLRAEPAGQFRISNGVELTLIDDGVWSAPCRLIVTIGAAANVDCSFYADGPVGGHPPFAPVRKTPNNGNLTDTESSRLTELLENPEFWKGSIAGVDCRYADCSFVRLDIRSGKERAIIIASGNPTFSFGARQQLTRLLQSIQGRIERLPR
jgi:hypothetical protein